MPKRLFDLGSSPASAARAAALAATVACLSPLSSALAAGDCAPGDQLPCACDGTAPINATVGACFAGSLNRQVSTQTDSFAAKAFAGVSWPMDIAARAPDYGTTPAAAGPDYTTVLDGWKSTRDIFRRDGQPPVAWKDDARVLPEACEKLDLAAERAKHPNAKDIPTDLTPRLLDEYVNPEGHALIDGAGQPVRYEVSMNRQAYDYVGANRLWEASALSAFLEKHGKLELPMGLWNVDGSGRQSRGAIVTKTAWKILDPKADDYDAFHKSWAYVTPIIKDGRRTHGCALEPVGLVGLHLILKLDLFPDWIWATYRHADVAPTWAEIGISKGFVNGKPPSYIFYSNDDSGARLNQPAKDVLKAQPSRIVRDYPDGYYYTPLTDIDTSKPPPPVDCTNSYAFKCFNERLAGGFEGVALGHYRLIGSQWRLPENQGGRPTPEVLGNPTLETFTQTTSTCLGCHSYATAEDGAKPPQTLDHIFSFYNDVLARPSPRQQK